MIIEASKREGTSKSGYILEAVYEKSGLIRTREKAIREFAGWLSHEETENLRNTTEVFNRVLEKDWD